MEEVYKIRRGVMRAYPEDLELKQLVKYLFVFVSGLYVGYHWIGAHIAGRM